MKIRIKGIYAARRAIASGEVRTCYYHRRSKTRLPGRPGTPAFIDAALELEQGRKLTSSEPAWTARQKGRKGKTFGLLIEKYRGSLRYQQLQPRTRQEYDRQISYVETSFDLCPCAAIGAVESECAAQDR